MDEEYRQRLRADADGGNKIAERLLLNAWLAEENQDEIDGLLDRYAAKKDELGKKYLEAELSCFHGWPGEQSWQELLRECCDSGHREALFTSSVYREWAKFSDSDPSPEPAADVLWDDAWLDWTAPDWTQVVEQDGVTVERSELFAPSAVIGFVRALLGPQLSPSAVVNPQTGESMAHPVRINQSAQWFPELLGWAGKLFECRLADACGYCVSHGEVLNLLQYHPGQRYKPHVDCFGAAQAKSPAGQVQGGQRMMTVLVAMGNNDFTGGETAFPQLKESVRLTTGQLLRFNNADTSGQPLPASLHEGRPVQTGEKWLLSKWVRQLPTPYGREISLAGPEQD
jgi:hypothetical protein